MIDRIKRLGVYHCDCNTGTSAKRCAACEAHVLLDGARSGSDEAKLCSVGFPAAGTACRLPGHTAPTAFAHHALLAIKVLRFEAQDHHLQD